MGLYKVSHGIAKSFIHVYVSYKHKICWSIGLSFLASGTLSTGSLSECAALFFIYRFDQLDVPFFHVLFYDVLFNLFQVLYFPSQNTREVEQLC